MPEQQKGTLEAIGLEVTKLFLPFKERIDAGEILQLLAELGIEFPLSLAEDADFQEAVTGVANKVDQLVTTSKELTTAIKAEDDETSAEKLKQLIELIAGFVSDFQTIADKINSNGPYPGISDEELSDFLQDLAVNLLEYLLIDYLKSSVSLFVLFLEFFGIVEETIGNEGSTNPIKPQFQKSKLRLDRLPQLIKNPSDLIRKLYAWGGDDEDGSPFTGDKLFRKLGKIVNAMGWPAVYDESGAEPELDLLLARMIPRTDLDPSGIELIIDEPISGGPSQTFNFGKSSLEVGFTGELGAETSLVIKPDGTFKINPPAGFMVEGGAFANWTAKNTDTTEPLLLIGTANASRLEAKEISAFLGLEFDWQAEEEQADAKVNIKIEIKDGKLLIKSSDPDGFLAQILPEDGIALDFGILIGFDSDRGFYFEGSGGLKVQLPVNVQLGPLLIHSIILSIGAGSEGLPIGIGANIVLDLGPFAAVVEDMGIKANLTFPQNNDGNLGAVNFDVDFKPPTRIGLALYAGAVKGGGFLGYDSEAGSYTGILQLSIKEVVNVIAIGLITTKGPNGEEDQFSMLLIITAEFTPIQLSFGFTLNGVGGLIGVNRTMDIDALDAGVRTNALDNILFPTNPVANATQIISDLETVFPPAQARHAFGLMGKLGWGTPTLITLEIGLMIEVPNPVTLAILGVIKMALPEEEKPTLKLQVNFIGIIDFEAQYISFDASLFDSKLLNFTLEGDMALRIKWGNQSNFIFTIGGFHPSYTPPPLALPEMRRLSINILIGNPRLTASTYFAVTSNTVQFGAAVDFYYKVSKYKVIGYLDFDALFQFDPFYFNIALASGMGVYVGSSEILSIHLSGILEGPTPWHITGRVKFKILWVVSINVSVETTWGETKDTSLPDVEVMPKLKEALENMANWLTPIEATGDNPDQMVSIRTIENTNDNIIAHPNRSLSVSQKVVPLDITIEKFGTQNPADFNHFHLDMVDGDGEELSETSLKEEFAPDSFFKLKESERLDRPSFEKYNSGLEGTGSSQLRSDFFRERKVEFETIILDELDPAPVLSQIDAKEFGAFVKNGSAAKSSLSNKNTNASVLAPAKVLITEESYAIVDTDDLSIFEDKQLSSMLEAQEAITNVIAERPDLEGQLEIVSTFELI
jgi:hypothetical protein